MVETSSLLPVAEALKLFGNNGTLVVKFRPNALLIFKESEPLFALMDGIPVPFFIASFLSRGNNRALILFDTIYSEAHARDLVGKTLYQVLPVHRRDKGMQQSLENSDFLVGFTVTDMHLGQLGRIEAFMDWNMNPCLSIRLSNHSGTILAPFQEAFISHIDLKTKIITMSLPEGLVNIQKQD